jgi:hypothetical protein
MEFCLGRPFPAASLVDESRHDFFHNMHKALRLGHCRMIAAMGAHDFSDEEKTADLLGRLRAMLGLARLHLLSENREIQGALEERRPGSSQRMAEGHADLEQAFAELESLIRSVEVATLKRRNRAGHALYRHYSLFAAAEIRHMNEEETELLTQLHHAFSDEELKAIEARMMAALDPASLAACLSLMLPALNPPEREDMLARLRASLPSPMFEEALRNALSPALTPEALESTLQAIAAPPLRTAPSALWQSRGEPLPTLPY